MWDTDEIIKTTRASLQQQQKYSTIILSNIDSTSTTATVSLELLYDGTHGSRTP